MILYGAFDRHNFGDLLLPHVCAALLPGRPLHFAGLATRDLRRCGGHAVTALPRLIAECPEHPAVVLHVGGEILTTSAWEAAVMLLPPRELRHTVAYLEPRPHEQREWVQRTLGTASLAPYMAPCEWLPRGSTVRYHAIGGFDLSRRDPAMRSEVLDKLRAAADVSVRDAATLAQLRSAGVPVRLVPDPAVRVAELFGARIQRHAGVGEVARLRTALPRGHLAAQFSAEFADDAALDAIASQLDEAASPRGLGVAFFRAGAAPWHDDLRLLRRAAGRMHTATAVLVSLDLWDLCALIATSRAYCGSSLHGRIVAMAFGVPRVGLCTEAGRGRACKQGAFAATWEPPGLMPDVVAPSGIGEALRQALAADPRQLRQAAATLALRHREEPLT